MDCKRRGHIAAGLSKLDLSTKAVVIYPIGVYNECMDKNIKKRLIRRLRILEGQIRGLQGMVEKEKYCIDILNQSSAAKQALSGVEDLLLENHLTTHVVEQIKLGQEEKSIKEILDIYKVSKKQ